MKYRRRNKNKAIFIITMLLVIITIFAISFLLQSPEKEPQSGSNDYQQDNQFDSRLSSGEINTNDFSEEIENVIDELSKVTAKSYLLMSGKTGEVILEKAGYTARQPASTTKILTAITALDSGSVDQRVKVTLKAASTGEASVNLNEDDVLSLEQLLYGALIQSGNDATVAIAEGLAPSEEEFVARMNLKALTLGATNTDFYNTNGLPNSMHLTSAYDLALITRYALDDPLFSNIVKTQSYRMSWQMPQRTLQLKNTNLLLQLDSRVIGVKTGTTNAAGKCLVSAIDLGNDILIGVVLDAQDRYKDMQALFNYGDVMRYNYN